MIYFGIIEGMRSHHFPAGTTPLSLTEWQKICCMTEFNRGNCENATKMNNFINLN